MNCLKHDCNLFLHYHSNVKVKDRPGLQTIINVSLTIIDINDNGPVCGKDKVTVKIPRDETVGTMIYNLYSLCSDNDYVFNNITYHIADDSCKGNLGF